MQSLSKTLTKASDWCANNPDVLIVLATGTVWLSRVIIRGVKKPEIPHDRSPEHYWEILKLLSPEDMDAVDQREKNGENLADILDGFRV